MDAVVALNVVNEIADARDMWGAEDGAGQQRTGRSRSGKMQGDNSKEERELPWPIN